MGEECAKGKEERKRTERGNMGEIMNNDSEMKKR